MAKTLSAAELAKRKTAADKERQRKLAEARAQLHALTDKDEWPESEHEARFEAAVRCALFANKIR